MKTITINVSEPVYADFKRYASQRDRPTSELIRESMEVYRELKIRPRKSLRELRPASIGGVIKPWSGRSELVEDLLDSRARD